MRDEEEALRLANDSDDGLSGNAWTNDLTRGEAIAARMQTGSVAVDDIAVTYGIAEAPFGGLEASGVGQVNGEIGIRGYCHLHPIITATTKKAQGRYPCTLESAAGLQKIVKNVFGNRWLRKMFV